MFRYTPGAGHYTQVVWAATQAVGCGLVNYGVVITESFKVDSKKFPICRNLGGSRS